MICGQGVLFSKAWDEVEELSSLMGMPVGTTISGKGAVSDDNPPLSIGVVGSRGGSSFSNSMVAGADLVFLVGTNADSVDTWDWRVPPPRGGGSQAVIHLDVSEANLGNMYRTDVFLMGDAKLTLRRMIELAREKGGLSRKRIDVRSERLASVSSLQPAVDEGGRGGVDPLLLVKALQRSLPDDWVVAVDPGGVGGAIYTSAFMEVRKPGRRFLYDYSIGAWASRFPPASVQGSAVPGSW